MKLDEVLGSARDTFTVKRVYGEPYEKGDVTVIPAAAVATAGVEETVIDLQHQRAKGGAINLVVNK